SEWKVSCIILLRHDKSESGRVLKTLLISKDYLIRTLDISRDNVRVRLNIIKKTVSINPASKVIFIPEGWTIKRSPINTGPLTVSVNEMRNVRGPMIFRCISVSKGSYSHFQNLRSHP